MCILNNFMVNDGYNDEGLFEPFRRGEFNISKIVVEGGEIVLYHTFDGCDY